MYLDDLLIEYGKCHEDVNCAAIDTHTNTDTRSEDSNSFFAHSMLNHAKEEYYLIIIQFRSQNSHTNEQKKTLANRVIGPLTQNTHYLKFS